MIYQTERREAERALKRALEPAPGDPHAARERGGVATTVRETHGTAGVARVTAPVTLQRGVRVVAAGAVRGTGTRRARPVVRPGLAPRRRRPGIGYAPHVKRVRTPRREGEHVPAARVDTEGHRARRHLCEDPGGDASLYLERKRVGTPRLVPAPASEARPLVTSAVTRSGGAHAHGRRGGGVVKHVRVLVRVVVVVTRAGARSPAGAGAAACGAGGG